MASSKPVVVKEEVLKNELECPVCMEEPRLHLLPCAHRCCMSCVDRLAGRARKLDCPICRKPTAVPDQGFPVCVLTERIKDELKLARQNAGSAKSIEPEIKGVESKCQGCNDNSVQSRCNICLKFLCLKCVVRDKQCTTVTKRHETELIDDILLESQIALNKWQEDTASQIGALKSELTPLNEKQTGFKKEKATLLQRLRTVKSQITSVEQQIKSKQEVLSEKSSLLKAAEIIQSEGNIVEIIRLTEQICDPKNVTTPPTLTLQAVSDKFPASFKFVSQHPTRTNCVTVYHHSITGDILLGCDDGMKIYSRDSGEVRHVTDHVKATAVEYKGEVFISHHADNKTVIKVIKYDVAKNTSELLFSFPMKSAFYASFLSVSDHFIVAIDKDNNTTKLYARQAGNRSGSNTLTTLTLPEYETITNLKLLTDDTLLVTGWDEENTFKLDKYRFNRDRPHLIWSCKEAPKYPYGIAVDDRGRIYVSGYQTKTIYVLSNEGKKLSELSHDRLPSRCVSISIRGTELAVAGFSEKQLLLFAII